MTMWRWLMWMFGQPEEPNTDRLPDWTDRLPLDVSCPDTMPTSPGALDSDRGEP